MRVARPLIGLVALALLLVNAPQGYGFDVPSVISLAGLGTDDFDQVWPDLDANGAKLAEAPAIPAGGTDIDRVEGAGLTVGTALAAASITPDPLVQEVAAALRNDPLAIYNYVKTEIAFDPIYGLKRSPHLTILERTGTDADQALLLVELLNAAGVSASYRYGTIQVPLDLAASWVRVDEDPADVGRTCQRVANALGSGRVPLNFCILSTDLASSAIDLEHVWVTTDISAVTHELDPSIKRNQKTDDIDLQTPLAYDRAAFIARAEQNEDATIDPDFVLKLNAGNIAEDLEQFAANLVANIEASDPHAYVRDIVGGWDVAETPVDVLPQVLPYPSTVIDSFDSFDAVGAPELRHKVSVTALNCLPPSLTSCSSLDDAFETTLADLAGKRLTYRFSGTQGELLLEGVVQQTGHSFADVPVIEFCYDTPFADSVGDECAKRVVVDSDGNTYAFVTEAGRVPKSLLQERRAVLAANQEAFLPDSEEVLGETLHVLGLSWFNENGASERLHEAIAGVNGYRFHGMAVMSQETAVATRFGIDVKLNFVDIYSYRPAPNDYAPALRDPDRDAFFTAGVAQGSGIEHAFIEQLQDKDAISTVKILEIANSEGQEIFLGTQSNWFGTVRPQLCYDTNTLLRLDAAINAGFTLVVPKCNVTLNSWTGTGWIEFTPNQEGYIIQGGLSGGFCTNPPCETDATKAGAPETTDNTARAGETQPEMELVVDPVHPQTGVLTLAETDVSVAGSRPLSIENFERFYNSGVADVSGPLGFGWRDTYGWTLSPTSDYGRGLEGPKATDAARLIAEAFVVQDMIRATSIFDHERREIEAIAIMSGEWTSLRTTPSS